MTAPRDGHAVAALAAARACLGQVAATAASLSTAFYVAVGFWVLLVAAAEWFGYMAPGSAFMAGFPYGLAVAARRRLL